MKSKARKHAMFVLLAIPVILLGAYFIVGYAPDPKFAQAKLLGLDSTETVRRLGQPDDETPVDSNGEETWGPMDGAGSFHLYYRDKYGWQGYSYEIFFEKGHVVRVAVGHK